MDEGHILIGKHNNGKLREGKRYELQPDGSRTLFQYKKDQEG